MIIITLLIDYLISYYFYNSFNLVLTSIYIINRLYFKNDKLIFLYVFIYELLFSNIYLIFLIVIYILYRYISIMKKKYSNYLFIVVSSLFLISILRIFLVLILGYGINIRYMFINLLIKIVVFFILEISNKMIKPIIR